VKPPAIGRKISHHGALCTSDTAGATGAGGTTGGAVGWMMTGVGVGVATGAGRGS
jgi:hypothetical protein